MPKDKNSQRLRNVRHARVRKKVEGRPNSRGYAYLEV